MNLKHFKEEEFRKATPSCSLSDMDEEFMSKLDVSRDIAGIPFVINSAFRPSAWDLSKGRSGSGAHTKIPCKAVDIKCVTNAQRFCILSSLLVVGFRRIGIGSNFIHVDDEYPNSQPIIWTY